MKNKTVAILLAFFCGGLGIHKFYLGENLAGVLYLLFFWTFIPSIFAFFDFLGLALMANEAFEAKYNQRYVSSYSSPHYLGSGQDKVAILSELKKLYDTGVITAEEYEEKRRKYLDSL